MARRRVTAIGVLALACVAIGVSGGTAAATTTDPALTSAQLHDLQQVTSWHITESTDYEYGGSGSGTFGGGGYTWSGSSTESETTDADVVVSGPAGCVYNKDITQDCVPVSGSGSLHEDVETSEQVSEPLCSPPFDQGASFSDSFVVDGTGAFPSDRGYFSIDYSTNPPRAYASMYSADIPGTHSATVVPQVASNPDQCSAGGTTSNDTSDDSFLSFFFGPPSLDEEGDTQVQVEGDQFVIHDAVSYSTAQTGSVFFYQNLLPRFTFPVDVSNTADWTATAPIPRADVSVTKTGPASARRGNTLAYTIAARNDGPSDANNFSVQDPLPANTTFVSATQTSGPPFSCRVNGFTGALVCLPNGLGATRFTFPSGAAATFRLVLKLSATAPIGGTISNTATATSSVTDPDTTNNSASVDTVVAGKGPDVGVTKAAPATAVPGGRVAYHLSVLNRGSSPMLGVRLVDPLPAGTTFVSLAQTTGSPFACSTPAAGAHGQVSCTLDQLAVSTHAAFSLVVALASSAADGSVLANTATVSTDSQDVDAADDSATALSAVAASADLAVTKTAPATVVAGNRISYRLKAIDHGPSDAQDVALSDPLPAGATLVSVTQTSGPAFACTAPPAGSNGTVTCTLGTLPKGQSAMFTVVARISPSAAAGSSVSNTASVSASTPDAVAADDSATTTTTVETEADLAVTKHVSLATVAPHHQLTYTIRVVNHGPSDAQAVALSDPLPAGTTFTSETQTAGTPFSCTTPTAGGTGTVDCSAGSLAAGASATIKVVVKVSAGTGSDLENTATVASSTPDPDPSNDTATASSTVS